MKTEFAKVDNVHGKLTVVVEKSDYADAVKKQLKEIGKKYSEPGFRPGKVPAAKIERLYGDSVRYDEVNKLVGNAIYEYIKENKLPVLGSPIPSAGNNPDFNLDEFTLTFDLGLSPEFTVRLDKDVTIPYYKIEVTDEMVDRQDQEMRRRKGRQEPGDEVNDTALVKGVITELNPDGTVKEDGIVVENGIVAPQYFKDDNQKNIFIGKHPGDSVVFNPAATCDGNPTELSSMLNLDKDDTEAHHGDFRFDIKEIIVLNPAELGEEYYKSLFGPDTEVKDEAAYREEVKKMIEHSLEGDSNYRFTIDAKNKIMEETGELELPWDILEPFLIENNEDLTKENFEEAKPELRKELEWELEKEKAAVELGVKLTEEDLQAMAKAMAARQFAQYGMPNPPQEAIDRLASDILKDEKFARQLANQAAEQKLFHAIREAVNAEVKEVSVEDFNKLFAPAE